MNHGKTIGLLSAAIAALFFVAAPSPARAQTAGPLPQAESELTQFAVSGYLGVSATEVTASAVKQLKLPEQSGVYVDNVIENTPAAKAGLKKGDVITEYDGMKVEGVEEFMRLVRETPPGREAQLTVWRDGQSQNLTAQIGQAPGPGGNEFYGRGPQQSPNFRFAPGFGPGYVPGNGNGPRQFFGQRPPETPTLGIAVQNLSGQLGQYFGAPNGEGVLVTEVRQGSPAEKAGVKAGDVIVKLDNDNVRNIEELRERLSQHNGQASVTLDVLRKGAEMTLTVMPQQPPPPPTAGNQRIPL